MGGQIFNLIEEIFYRFQIKSSFIKRVIIQISERWVFSWNHVFFIHIKQHEWTTVAIFQEISFKIVDMKALSKVALSHMVIHENGVKKKWESNLCLCGRS